VKPLVETIKAIRRADLIVLGPGSLYTSILPNLLVQDICNELCSTKAKKVYVCNVMTQPGETLGFKASDHIKALYNHMPCAFLDAIIVNNAPIPAPLKKKYQVEQAQPVEYDREVLLKLGLEVIEDQIIQYDGSVIRHDTKKVAKLVYSMLTSLQGKTNTGV
jgi:uncharacterized cofD-like protein